MNVQRRYRYQKGDTEIVRSSDHLQEAARRIKSAATDAKGRTPDAPTISRMKHRCGLALQRFDAELADYLAIRVEPDDGRLELRTGPASGVTVTLEKRAKPSDPWRVVREHTAD